MTRIRHNVMTYAEADAKIGKYSTKKIGHNTFLRRDDGIISIQYHATKIVTINKDGSYTLNTGGYRTVTTKARLNEYTPAQIYQKDFVWYNNGDLYYDGMTVDSSGKALESFFAPV